MSPAVPKATTVPLLTNQHSPGDEARRCWCRRRRRSPELFVHGGFFGTVDVPGAQAEAVRVPHANGTLSVLPVGEDDELMPSLLTLADVMGTGHHAAVVAGVEPGHSVAVVGDGAVGLCGVIAARRLGADRIIIMGRHADR